MCNYFLMVYAGLCSDISFSTNFQLIFVPSWAHVNVTTFSN